MKKSAGKILSLMLTAAMTAGVLAGCGSSTAETTAAAGTTAAAATEAAKDAETTAAAAEEKDYSQDIITYGMTQAWDTINPYGSTSGSIAQNLSCDKLYDRLAFIEEAGTGVSARGAKSWETADDGMAAIFHLDENAKWHDGEPVTAQDWV